MTFGLLCEVVGFGEKDLSETELAFLERFNESSRSKSIMLLLLFYKFYKSFISLNLTELCYGDMQINKLINVRNSKTGSSKIHFKAR